MANLLSCGIYCTSERRDNYGNQKISRKFDFDSAEMRNGEYNAAENYQ